MPSHTSIAIVTKNRPKELYRCLESILGQTKQVDSVILIDNDLKGSARKIAHDKFFTVLNITYQKCKGSVPVCRNTALKLNTNKYLGFVDDDCVLQKNWLKNGLQKIEQKDLAYVLGHTLLYNPQNVLAQAQHLRDACWKKYNTTIFDTKNVLLHAAKIKKARLHFDKHCQSSYYDSADFDFDFQVRQTKLKGANCTTMILAHQETNKLNRFLKRAYHRGRLGHYLDRKWRLQDRLSGGRDANMLWWLLRSIKNFSHYQKQYKSTIAETLVIRLFDYYYALGYLAHAKRQT